MKLWKWLKNNVFGINIFKKLGLLLLLSKLSNKIFAYPALKSLAIYQVVYCVLHLSFTQCELAAGRYSILPGAIFVARKNNGKVVRSAFDHTSWWKLGVTAKGIYIWNLMRKSRSCWFFFLSHSWLLPSSRVIVACGRAGCRTQFCSLFVLGSLHKKFNFKCISHPSLLSVCLTLSKRSSFLIK